MKLKPARSSFNVTYTIPKLTSEKVRGVSWWMGLDRDAFAKAAQARKSEMRTSREANFAPTGRSFHVE